MRRLYCRRELFAFSPEESQTAEFGSLLTRVKHPLHPQTNSKQRDLPIDGAHDCLSQRAGKSACSLKVSNSGDNDVAGIIYHFRISRYHRVMAKMAERFLYRGKIAGLIIDDGDHRSPLVLGSKRAICRSRQQAARSAREKALNSDSIL